MSTDPIKTWGAGEAQIFDTGLEPPAEQERLNRVLKRKAPDSPTSMPLAEKCKVRPLIYLVADSGRHQAVVRDVSRERLGVFVPRSFEPGTRLDIQFQWGQGELCWVISAEIKHTALQLDGSWLLGCLMSRPFSDTELATLQLHFPAANLDAGSDN